MPGRDHTDDEGPWLQFVKSTLTTSSYKPITLMICWKHYFKQYVRCHTHVYKLIIILHHTENMHVLCSILCVS